MSEESAMSAINRSEWMTLAEASELTRVSTYLIRKATLTGLLEVSREDTTPGRFRYLVPKKFVEAWASEIQDPGSVNGLPEGLPMPDGYFLPDESDLEELPTKEQDPERRSMTRKQAQALFRQTEELFRRMEDVREQLNAFRQWAVDVEEQIRARTFPAPVEVPERVLERIDRLEKNFTYLLTREPVDSSVELRQKLIAALS